MLGEYLNQWAAGEKGSLSSQYWKHLDIQQKARVAAASKAQKEQELYKTEPWMLKEPTHLNLRPQSKPNAKQSDGVLKMALAQAQTLSLVSSFATDYTSPDPSLSWLKMEKTQLSSSHLCLPGLFCVPDLNLSQAQMTDNQHTLCISPLKECCHGNFATKGYR